MWSTSHSAVWNAQPQPTPIVGSVASAASPTNAIPGRAAGRITFGTSSLPISFETRSASSIGGAPGPTLTAARYARSASARNSGRCCLCMPATTTLMSSSLGNHAMPFGSANQRRASVVFGSPRQYAK